MIFHTDNTLPTAENAVFVFGSNLKGVHGAGAAKQALHYGAKSGYGTGRSGQSYAIPTKDRSIQTLSLSEIRIHISDFNQYAKANRGTEFFVTRVGCGLAGYDDYDIAPMFAALKNCNFAEEWRLYVGRDS